jgi:hypothetical protein
MASESRNQTDKPKQELSVIYMLNRNITSFEALKISPNCSSIILDQNCITDFVGLPDLQRLTQLSLDSNQIRSFKGCKLLPSLRWISLKNSPIASNVHFKLMCLIAFGPQLASINAEQIPKSVRLVATTLRDDLFPQLEQGAIISKLKPLRLVDIDTETPTEPDSALVDKSIGLTPYTTPRDKAYAKSLRSKPVEPSISLAAICNRFLGTRMEISGLILDDIASKFEALKSEFTEEKYFQEEKSDDGNQSENDAAPEEEDGGSKENQTEETTPEVSEETVVNADVDEGVQVDGSGSLIEPTECVD